MPHRLLFPPEPLCDPVRANARLNRAMLFVGAACLTVGVRFFLAPEQLDKTSVGRALDGLWDETWSVLYILGGALITSGIVLRRPRLELPGLTLCATATIVNGAAIVAVLGWERGLSQLPLYVLALWVFDGRIRDMLELPRERRAGRPDRRPPEDRAERRLMSLATPAALLAAGGFDAGTILVALMGGGLVTAVAQAFLYRPQRRNLEAEVTHKAVTTVDEMLGRARSELRAAWNELDKARTRIDELEANETALERTCAELERRVRELEAAAS